MKLKNKKTGEIATLTLSSNGEDMIIMGNDMYAHITKLSELKDYEDYEEPKEYWYIDWTPEIRVYYTKDVGCDSDKWKKEIGNYFETKEDAEKAMEKLKAFKRLKDKGFRFELWNSKLAGEDHLECCGHININASIEPDSDCRQDLDLLFGGEE